MKTYFCKIRLFLLSLTLMLHYGCAAQNRSPTEFTAVSGLSSAPNNSSLGYLPATFFGITPCADCPGIEETLSLNKDGTFSLKRIYQERPVAPFIENGRWSTAGTKLTLTNASGAQRYETIDNNTLRKLDVFGGTNNDPAIIDLHRVTETQSVNQAQQSSQSNESDSTAQLINTYWKLVELDGKPIPPPALNRREARITLASEDNKLIGFAGCNRLFGTFFRKGNELNFLRIGRTRMACEQPYMALENQVIKILGATTHYRIEGEVLVLLMEAKVLARFEAVYLR